MKEFVKKVFSIIKEFLLEWRKTLTLLSAGLGLGLAWLVLKYKVTEWIFCLVGYDVITELKKGLFLIVLAAPTSYYLWFLRNEDKLKQIEYQGESNQYQEENSRFNSFSNALKLFFEKENKEANTLGLQLLMKIRNIDGYFADQIDLATPKKDLQKANLSDVDLSNTNLMGANLCGTNLSGAKLLNADLTQANLSNDPEPNSSDNQFDLMKIYFDDDKEGADLTKAILTGANLTGAILTGAILTDTDLTGVNLTGADLTNTNLTSANLTGVTLINTTIEGIRLTINKQDFTSDEIDYEFLKKDFRKVTDPMLVKIVEKEEKYYLEKW